MIDLLILPCPSCRKVDNFEIIEEIGIKCKSCKLHLMVNRKLKDSIEKWNTLSERKFSLAKKNQ